MQVMPKESIRRVESTIHKQNNEKDPSPSETTFSNNGFSTKARRRWSKPENRDFEQQLPLTYLSSIKHKNENEQNNSKNNSNEDLKTYNSSDKTSSSVQVHNNKDDLNNDNSSSQKYELITKYSLSSSVSSKSLHNSNNCCNEHEIGTINKDESSKIFKLKKKLSEDDLEKNKKSTSNNFKMKSKTINHEKIVEITIHKTDLLKEKFFTYNKPALKVSIMNCSTNKFLQKSSEKRDFTWFYKEKKYYDNNYGNYIEPFTIHPCNLKNRCHFLPVWEEKILLNVDFEFFISENPKMIIFFEVLDTIISKQGAKEYTKIAWAFLKIRGKGNHLNISKDMRLQLFYPGHNSKLIEFPNSDVFKFWSSKKIRKYPSTIYISIKEFEKSNVIETIDNSEKLIIEKEQNVLLNKKDNLSNKTESIVEMNDSSDFLKENIIFYKKCVIPNKLLGKFQTPKNGCLAIKFSNNGKYLACGIEEGYKKESLIVVFNTETFEKNSTFPGHEDLIYDICWSKDDKFIISSSSDCSICISNFEEKKIAQIIPLASYTYCCLIIQSNNIILSGGYDAVLRIWRKNDAMNEFVLYQKLEDHSGFITSFCAKKDDSLYFSSDSNGKIIEWLLCSLTKKWKIKKNIVLAELIGTKINQVLLDSKEFFLFIHARDSCIRLLDLRRYCIFQWFKGALNNEIQTFFCICNCSSYLLCGSENGFLHIWDVNKAKSIGKYMPYNLSIYKGCENTVHNVQFNPKKNQFAISHCGSNLPILLYGISNNNS